MGNLQSTISYVVLRYNLRAISPSNHISSASCNGLFRKQQARYSKYIFPGTKAYCFSEIILGRICFKRFARPVANILYKMLHNAIGRKSLVGSALSFFGIRTTLVSLTSAGTLHSCNHNLQQVKTSLPNESQKCWKKAGLSPFGPDAFVWMPLFYSHWKFCIGNFRY